MSKPWLYEYATEPLDCFGNKQAGAIEVMDAVRCTLCGCAGVHGCPGPSKGWTETLVDEVRRERAQKAALVRALLAVEWEGCSDCFDGGHAACPECNGDGPGTYVKGPPPHDHIGQHAKGCGLDELLTSAGLPDQASRDEARADIAKLAKETAR